MSTSTHAARPQKERLTSKQARKVVTAGRVGIFVELYNNVIFAFIAGTLALVFLAPGNPDHALVFVFAGYALSLFVGPLGAVVCGYPGDRIGRQKLLVFVILLISVATAGIGVLPTYAAIGLAAPILLVLLQGFSVGGETAGAMTFLAERAPAGKRGINTSYAQIASFAALLTGTLVAFSMSPRLTQAAIDDDGFGAFTWRVPFLAAIAMGVIGWYIRKAISETPNFVKLKEEGGLSKNPLKEAFASAGHRRAMALALFLPLMNGSGYYVLFSYMPTFLRGKPLKFTTSEAMLVTACSLVAICIAIPFMGALSDRVGRKKVFAGSAVAIAVLGYNISWALFGGTAPLLMTWLISSTGNIFMPAFYAVITALGTFGAVSTVKDRAHLPLPDASPSTTSSSLGLRPYRRYP